MTSSVSIAIVPIAPEHIEGFHRALDIVARERRYLALLEAFPLPQMREFVLNVMNQGGVQFVAVADDEVVGWCDIRRYPFPSQAHRGILGMGLTPVYRGRGLGFQLINAALKQASGTGLLRVELDVRADNTPAIALYDKVGFVREGVIRDAVFIDGEYYDSIMMARLAPHHSKTAPQ